MTPCSSPVSLFLEIFMQEHAPSRCSAPSASSKIYKGGGQDCLHIVQYFDLLCLKPVDTFFLYIGKLVFVL